MAKKLVSAGFVFLLLAITYAYSSDLKKGKGWGSEVKTSEPPLISSLLKPLLLKRVLEDKEIVAHASLDKLPNSPQDNNKKKYSIYASMLVSSSVKEAYTALTDYKLYAKLVPFIESAVFSPISHILRLEGGIWSFRLSSQILFTEQLDRWIHFDIIGGHFTGLSGNIYFESKGEKGTLVYLSGEQIGTHWPPTFIIERGAEIVFGFTAQRMRSYIESTKKAQQGAKHGDHEERQIPEPRNHL
ncbi:MAG: hypothetical protein ABIQ95_08715 [Bdellovibrionia bacterium]